MKNPRFFLPTLILSLPFLAVACVSEPSNPGAGGGGAGGTAAGGTAGKSSGGGGGTAGNPGGSGGGSLAGAGGTAGGGGAAGSTNTTGAAGGTGVVDAAMPGLDGPPSMEAGGIDGGGESIAYTVLFDGTSLENWVVDPAHCSIKDNAIQISGCWCMMWSKGDYDNFRLFVTTRVMSPTYTSDAGNEHMGIGVWGARTNGFSPTSTVEFTPQNCWMWNYVKGNDSKSQDQCYQPNFGGSDGWDNWKTTEFLFNMTEGTVKSAVDGVRMSNFTMTDKSYFKKGPFGLQMHGKVDVQYKDIKVEVNPKNPNLVSVK